MIDEIRGLLDQYAQWVRDKSVLGEVNDQYVEITTPYLDRHNDYTQMGTSCSHTPERYPSEMLAPKTRGRSSYSTLLHLPVHLLGGSILAGQMAPIGSSGGPTWSVTRVDRARRGSAASLMPSGTSMAPVGT